MPASTIKLYRFTALRPGTTNRILASLRDGTVFLQNPTKFNDPYDCQLTYDESVTAEELEVVRDFNTRRAATDPNARNMVAAINRMGVRVGAFVGQTLKAMFAQSGVCCFTETWDIPLMWGHYADQHRGMCLGYEADLNTLGGCSLLPVLYATDHFSVRVFQFLVDRGAFFQQMILTKQVEWSYEREWRLIRDQGGLLNPSPLQLKAVIFGLRSDPRNEVRVRSALKKQQHVQFHRVVKAQRGFRFVSVPA